MKVARFALLLGVVTATFAMYAQHADHKASNAAIAASYYVDAAKCDSIQEPNARVFCEFRKKRGPVQFDENVGEEFANAALAGLIVGLLTFVVSVPLVLMNRFINKER